MKYFHVIATVFLVAVICIESGSGIKCFVCNSFQQQDCEDTFDNSTYKLTDCGAEYDRCRKIVQELKVNKEWEVRYIRQCAKGGLIGKDEGKVCKDRIGTSGVKMKYCHCNNIDGCNTASSWNLPVTLLVATLTGQYFLQKL